MTLRHFVLSLAAAFLALAVGVVLGARILSGPMVSGLRGDKGDLQTQVTTLTDDKEALNQRLSAADDFDARMAPRIVRDALAGKTIVLFRTPDAEDGDLDAVASLIGEAGGKVTGTVGLTQEFVSADTAEKLRSVVNSPIVPAGAQLDTTLVDPAAQAGDLLGIAVLINRDAAPVDATSRDTVFTTLRDTGFLTYDESPGASDAAVIVTGGALADNAGNRGAEVARFAAGLARHGSGTVLAGREGSADGTGAVAVARGDAGISGSVTTVDDIDAAAGRITVVLALQATGRGARPGSYGVGTGASAVTVG